MASQGKKRIAAIGAAVFVTAALIVAAYAVYVFSPPAGAGQTVRITIPPGSSSADIARLLEESGLIRSGRLFTWYSRLRKEGSRFQAGTYDLAKGLSQDELIAKLNAGETVKEETIRFTIPEGYTIPQMADKLEQEGIVGKGDFLRLADSSGWKDKWTPAIPELNAYRHRLEGYLFPETYELKKGSTAQDIIARMLEETDKKTGQLPSDWPDKLKARGLTFHQMLTVASLVEREAAADDERPVVAGVIYNRIARGMPLQIDATVQYLFDRAKDRLTEKDLRLESPFNTYLYPGLPPGPIASPGLASIKAAIYPAETNYLFYVTKKDGSGRHWFAETFEEHKANIARSKAAGS